MSNISVDEICMSYQSNVSNFNQSSIKAYVWVITYVPSSVGGCVVKGSPDAPCDTDTCSDCKFQGDIEHDMMWCNEWCVFYSWKPWKILCAPQK